MRPATRPRHVRDTSPVRRALPSLVRRAEAMVHTAHATTPPAASSYSCTRKDRSGTLPYHLCAACMLAAASIPLLLRRAEREAEEAAAQAQLREGTAAVAR